MSRHGTDSKQDGSEIVLLPMAVLEEALTLPGTKTGLVMRFDPDAYPGADEAECQERIEASVKIWDAYNVFGWNEETPRPKERRVDEPVLLPMAMLVAVLLLPGVRTWLLDRFNPDQFPDHSERERQWLVDRLENVIAAYEIVDRFK